MRYYRVYVTRQIEGKIYFDIFVKRNMLSDQMVYHLYGLTEDEIRIVEREAK